MRDHLIALDLIFFAACIVSSFVMLLITMALFDVMDWALNYFCIAPIPDEYRAPYMLLPSRSAKSAAGDE